MKPNVSYVSYLLFTILLIQGGYFVWQSAWSEVFVVVAAFVLSTIPYLLRQYYDVQMTEVARTAIVFFTVCTLILGEIHSFYDIFPWWDIFLHLFSGVGLAVLGYTWLRQLIHQKLMQSRPIFHTIFVFSTASTVLLLWEVYEFIIDLLGWSANLMQPSLFDTMTDIVIGLAGVIVVCAYGYYVLAQQKQSLLTNPSGPKS